METWNTRFSQGFQFRWFSWSSLYSFHCYLGSRARRLIPEVFIGSGGLKYDLLVAADSIRSSWLRNNDCNASQVMRDRLVQLITKKTKQQLLCRKPFLPTEGLFDCGNGCMPKGERQKSDDIYHQ
jgi:hypothetical protein